MVGWCDRRANRVVVSAIIGCAHGRANSNVVCWMVVALNCFAVLFVLDSCSIESMGLFLAHCLFTLPAAAKKTGKKATPKKSPKKAGAKSPKVRYLNTLGAPAYLLPLFFCWLALGISFTMLLICTIRALPART